MHKTLFLKLRCKYTIFFRNHQIFLKEKVIELSVVDKIRGTQGFYLCRTRIARISRIFMTCAVIWFVPHCSIALHWSPFEWGYVFYSIVLGTITGT